MDLVAEMLAEHLRTEHADRYEVMAIHPRFFRLFEALPGLDALRAWNADRLVTRFLTYPTELVVRRSKLELFHVADHSYAQIAHVLPRQRTGIYCHDLDAFRCLFQPSGAVSSWRKAIARAQLAGLQRAAVVFYSTEQVRKQIEESAIVDGERLVHAPYGVAADFFSDGIDQLPADALPSRPFLLHVGSSEPRKRLDVLFRLFARVRERLPDLVLVQQGARLLPENQRLLAELGIADALVQPPRLSRPALAALYHRAELVLLTSEREGFGLPILEALAGGAAVIASDIPPFREVGASAVTYCPVGDVERWTETVLSLIEHPELRPAAALRQAVAGRFTWTAHAAIIADAYARIAGLPLAARA
jgi:glycosyltransferase involved in cell wall biosynthesis